jgi:hypothetical protein
MDRGVTESGFGSDMGMEKFLDIVSSTTSCSGSAPRRWRSARTPRSSTRASSAVGRERPTWRALF